MIQSSDENDILGTLVEELIAQQRDGRPSQLEAFCEQYPEHAGRLRNLFETIGVIEKSKSRTDDSADDAHVFRDSGYQIGDYRIVREVGRGGMGVVYEAVQLSLGRHVALKIISQHLLTRQSAVARFRREARAAAQLHHSNIVPVFDVGREEDVSYYTMQFIPGQSLDQIIEELRRFRSTHRVDRRLPAISESIMYRDLQKVSSGKSNSSPSTQPTSANTNFASKSGGSSSGDNREVRRDESTSNSQSGISYYRNVARIGLQVAEALAHAHSRGVLHRDIKPSNILVDSQGTAWITDFGLAKADDSSEGGDQSPSLTQTGDIVGTLRYLAPERLLGKHDHRVDIYGLGATLYELLALRPMFDAVDRVHLMTMVSQQEPARLRKIDPRLPRDLETIVQKCVAKEPNLRYRSSQALADDLRLFILDRPIQSRRATWIEKTSRWCRKNPVVAGLLTLAVSLFIVLGFAFLINKTLKRQRDDAVVLYRRATAAENQSRIRAILNDVANYRISLAPDLEDHRKKLEKINGDELPADLRFELRNELAACQTRGDWFGGQVIPAPGVSVAMDRSRNWIAHGQASGTVTIFSRDKLQPPIESEALGFAPTWLRFSRFGKYLIASTLNNQFQILYRENGKIVHTGPQIVAGCDVCDATDVAAYWHKDNRVSLESTHPETRAKLLMEMQTDGMVTCCRINPQRNLLAFAQLGKVVVAEIPSGKHIFSIQGDFSSPQSFVEWSPDGKWLAVTDTRFHVQIWDVDNSECVSILDEQHSAIDALDWDAQSQYLAVRTWDGTIQVANVWSRQLLVRSKKAFSQCEFSDDGKSLGWNFSNQELQPIAWRPGLALDLPFNPRNGMAKPTQCIFHPTLRLMAVCSPEQVTWFDLDSNMVLCEMPTYLLLAAEFSKDADQLVILGRNAIQKWPLKAKMADADGVMNLQIGPPEIIPIDHISSGFLVGDSDSAIVTTSASTLAELDLSTGKTRRTIGPSNAFSAERLGQGDLCVLRSWRASYADIWNFRSRKLVGSISIGAGSNVFSDNRNEVIVTTNSSRVKFFEPQTLKTIDEIALDAPLVGPVIAFSPNAGEMALQLAPQYVSLVDFDSRQVLLRMPSDMDYSYNQFCFSPSGEFLYGTAAGAQAIRKWNVADLVRNAYQHGLGWQSDLRGLADQPLINSVAPAQPPFRISIDLGEVQKQSPYWSSLSIEEARHELLVYPNNPGSLNNLAWQLLTAEKDLRNNPEALALAQQIATRDLDASCRNTLALAFLRSGKLEEAEPLLFANLESATHDQLTTDLLMLAMISRSRGDQTAADRYRTWAETNRQQHPAKTLRDRQVIQGLITELDAM